MSTRIPFVTLLNSMKAYLGLIVAPPGGTLNINMLHSYEHASISDIGPILHCRDWVIVALSSKPSPTKVQSLHYSFYKVNWLFILDCSPKFSVSADFCTENKCIINSVRRKLEDWELGNGNMELLALKAVEAFDIGKQVVLFTFSILGKGGGNCKLDGSLN